MCVKINILPVEKRGWLAFMNDLQSVSWIKGERAERVSSWREKWKRIMRGVAFAENLFNTFERHVSLRLLHARLTLAFKVSMKPKWPIIFFIPKAAGTWDWKNPLCAFNSYVFTCLAQKGTMKFATFAILTIDYFRCRNLQGNQAIKSKNKQ